VSQCITQDQQKIKLVIKHFPKKIKKSASKM